jgi:translocation and assembly module TamB
MKRTAIIIAGSITAILCIAVLSAWWSIFHTERGVNWLLARLQTLQSMHIDVSGVSGVLAGPLKIKHFELDQQYVHIVADDISLAISPIALLTQTVRVSYIHIGSASVKTKHIDDTPTTKPLRFFASFLRLDLHTLTIDHAHFETVDGFVQEVDGLQVSSSLTANQLQVTDIQLKSQNLSVTGQVTLKAQRPIPLAIVARLQLPAPHGEEISANVSVGGDVQRMVLNAELTAPSHAHFSGVLSRTGPMQLTGKIESPQILLSPWMTKPPFSLQNIKLDLQIDSNESRLSGELRIPEWDDQPMTVQLHGRYANHVLALTQAILQPVGTPLIVRAAGRIDIGAGMPQINAGLEWVHFRWPLRSSDASAAFISPGGQASLSGSMPYNIGVNADVMLKNTIYTQVSAGGQLQSDRLSFDHMNMLLMDGAIQGNATMGFESREWQGDLTIEHLNPVQLSAQWPGSISGRIHGNGEGFERKSSFVVSVPELSGTLRGEPLHARGEVLHDGTGWRVQAVNIQLADAHADINGRIQDSIDISWSANAPSLQRLDSRLRGTLQTKGTLRGTVSKPQIEASLTGSKLVFDTWAIDSLNARSQAHLAGDGESTLEIGSRNVRLNGIGLGSPTFSAHVQPQQAPVRTSQPGKNAQSATGTWNMDQFCFAWKGDYRFCGAARYASDGAWQLLASSNDIPLGSLNDDESPDAANIQGRLHARIQAQARANQPWTGALAMQVSDTAITYEPIAGEEETIKVGAGDININATEDRLIATLRLVTPNTTQIDASGQLNRKKQQDWTDSELHAELHAHTDDANLLPAFIPDIDHAAGALEVEMSADGSLRSPTVAGSLHLSNAELSIYRYNLNLRELDVQAHLANNHFDFGGSGKLGDGSLNIDGQFVWKDQNPVGTLHFTGQQLTVYDIPEYHVLASPNVYFVVNGKRIDVSGEVLIPTARLQPTVVRGATEASLDARLITAAPQEKTRNADVFSNVSVRLGDDVKIDTLGLQGNLGGAVTIVSQPGERTIGRGELNVVSGRYEAYGQKLDIEHGRLLFTATPLDDPGLDIQAERKIEDQRVGVNVRGTLRAPRISLFAEPTLPQSQILSYLVTGKPIDDLSSSDKATIGTASNQLALQGGSILAAQLGKRIGLEQVDVESNGTTDTSIVLGKFLSPRLFVSYGISLTESINTLKLKYTLSDRWLLKTEIGKDQSADVEFRVER